MSVSLKINSRRWTHSIFANEGEYDLENELNDFYERIGKFLFFFIFMVPFGCDPGNLILRLVIRGRGQILASQLPISTNNDEPCTATGQITHPKESQNTQLLPGKKGNQRYQTAKVNHLSSYRKTTPLPLLVYPLALVEIIRSSAYIPNFLPYCLHKVAVTDAEDLARPRLVKFPIKTPPNASTSHLQPSYIP
ncbi:hypothetical protein Glove_48g120 [Diversispora epigaea]|uniref:Uncharacterized protein n=1 Tax=Diversispora epigaea TaxID=1348612 RepID=A0A397JQ76_9GLOM|nr:hypothetical protein Glove_48g120 [Diversispora epigaea]